MKKYEAPVLAVIEFSVEETLAPSGGSVIIEKDESSNSKPVDLGKVDIFGKN